jgi:carotenoid 1,2-hydratase
VALYGKRSKRWSLTERRRGDLHRDPSSLVIGPSSLSWDGNELLVRIDEITVPFPSRIRGLVRVRPAALVGDTYALDVAGQHHWRPIAPCARIEVVLERPALRWSGHAYLDSNRGDAPLEDAFDRWTWSRSRLRDGATAVLYDVRRQAGDDLSLALQFAPSGGVQDFTPPPRVPLPRTRWWVTRGTRGERKARTSVVQTLEDTPFYARSILSGHLLGQPVETVHESLSLDRFRSRWVQLLLPFRMHRRWR